MSRDQSSRSRASSRPWLAGLLFLCLAAVLTACQSSPPNTTPDSDRIEGHWQGRGPGGACTVTISGDRLRYEQPTGGDGKEFWYETRFVFMEGSEPAQLHATIVDDNSEEKQHKGTVVVVLYDREAEKLTLGVVNSFEEPPTEPIIGDWDRVMDLYELERAQ